MFYRLLVSRVLAVQGRDAAGVCTRTLPDPAGGPFLISVCAGVYFTGKPLVWEMTHLGGGEMVMPKKNYFWPQLPAGRVELRGEVNRYYVVVPADGGPEGVVSWDGQSAREAQADLDRRVFRDLPVDQKVCRLLEKTKGWGLTYKADKVLVKCDTARMFQFVGRLLRQAGLSCVNVGDQTWAIDL